MPKKRALPEKGDDWLWQHATKDVIPLSNLTYTINEKIGSEPAPKNKRTPNTYSSESQYKPNAKPLLYKHGAAPGLDKRTQMRLKRGQVKVEARIDLHGMSRAEAHNELIRIVEDSYYSGRRAVLVITGKGLRRDGSIGVLRSAVPGWFNEMPMRDWVRAFDHAAPRDGGEGALYVLLRRHK